MDTWPLMTPREKFIASLERRPILGLVPHFELVFYLTMEAFGKVHPLQRNYEQWLQMEEKERQLHRSEIAEVYIQTAERYDHSAIFIHPNPSNVEETIHLIERIRENTGKRYFIIKHGDATFSIPNGSEMMEFSLRLKEEPQKMKSKAERQVEQALQEAEKLRKVGGLDGFALCSDYCFNSGPFLRPQMFA
jgi:uroporphyrinogen decarboxylase